MIARRQALLLMSASGIGVFGGWPARALEPAEKLADVWPAVQAGKFDLAAQRLQVYVTEWPLNQDARSNLAILQFGAGMFAEAEKNLGRIVKLRRTYAADPRFELQYLEAWYRIAQLRAGQAPATPPPATARSLLTLLVGGRDPDTFAAQLTDAYFDFLDRMEESMGSPKTTTTSQGAEVTVTMEVERPERAMVERAYLCICNFMLGEQALGLGNQASGRKLLAEAAAYKAESEIEFHIAKAELARLG